MNVERIEKLAELLYSAVPEANFDMRKWFGRYDVDYYNNTSIKEFESELIPKTTDDFIPYECGTACCIAGWALTMANDFKPLDIRNLGGSWNNAAAEYLEINSDQAFYLFYTDRSSIWDDVFFDYEEIQWDEDEDCYVGITPKIASDVLYRIAYGNIAKFKEMELYDAY
jgi:hypothetical protein